MPIYIWFALILANLLLFRGVAIFCRCFLFFLMILIHHVIQLILWKVPVQRQVMARKIHLPYLWRLHGCVQPEQDEIWIVLSHMSKVLRRIIYLRLVNYVEEDQMEIRQWQLNIEEDSISRGWKLCEILISWEGSWRTKRIFGELSNTSFSKLPNLVIAI